MKFVVRINPETLKYDTFRYDDPGPVPPIIDPPEPDEAKDTEPPKPKEKPKPS